MKYFLVICVISLGQIQLAHAGDRMEHPLKEESGLETFNLDEHKISKHFFEDFNIFETILHSILENKSAGTVFTNNENNPSFVLVCSPSIASSPNAYAYLGGELDQESLRKVGSYLQKFPKVSLVVPIDWKFRTFFEELGFNPVERLQLRRPFDFFNLDTWNRSLPNHYSISRINDENFAQCNWHSFILSCYGDNDHFFANGIGFCLLDQGKIISESYGLIANGKAEIGVITDEKYRGQNLGTIICAIMLDYCYKNGLEPYWNCDVCNPASTAVAKKLGFEENCKYLFLKWIAP
jgi:RimJ/RimL family protein N-acetyltransferase